MPFVEALRAAARELVAAGYIPQDDAPRVARRHRPPDRRREGRRHARTSPRGRPHRRRRRHRDRRLEPRVPPPGQPLGRAGAAAVRRSSSTPPPPQRPLRPPPAGDTVTQLKELAELKPRASSPRRSSRRRRRRSSPLLASPGDALPPPAPPGLDAVRAPRDTTRPATTGAARRLATQAGAVRPDPPSRAPPVDAPRVACASLGELHRVRHADRRRVHHRPRPRSSPRSDATGRRAIDVQAQVVETSNPTRERRCRVGVVRARGRRGLPCRSWNSSSSRRSGFPRMVQPYSWSIVW